ncbi:hypothetical protein [Enterovirga aerilata]|uniref:Uncharacterized protein n=1 Tax=Enterovirga aerilata TaxID=2730920 RepID=A0A849I302_9HYPH|nr:hypothetical protein [Enterovirga sp. DB1703]NNM71738.1 hypothetical protein [Enterovirga sp. DB1703]
MPGPKTHEHQIRQFEAGLESQDWREGAPMPPPQRDSGSIDHPVAQESSHNKHNHPGQEGHKPQKHTPAQEKQI